MSPDIIKEMGKAVFRDMGRPAAFSFSAFQRKFWKEFEKRKLDEKDDAVRRRFFNEVMRRVKRFIINPPKTSRPQRQVDPNTKEMTNGARTKQLRLF